MKSGSGQHLYPQGPAAARLRDSPGPACGSMPPWTTCPRPRKTGRELNFIMYHGALRPFLEDPALELDMFEKTGDIRWATDLAEHAAEVRREERLCRARHDVRDLCRGQPALRGCLVGQMVNEMGADHVVWGTRLGVVRLAAVADRSHAPAGDPGRHDAEDGLEDQARRRRRPGQAQDLRRELRAAVQVQDPGGVRASSASDKLAQMKAEYEQERRRAQQPLLRLHRQEDRLRTTAVELKPGTRSPRFFAGGFSISSDNASPGFFGRVCV